jgi:hypothetical protein
VAGIYNQVVDQPTGRELLANLRHRHLDEAGPAAMAQQLLAILAGVVWWFTCIYYLLRAPLDDVETWHIVVIAVPSVAITIGWHYGASALGRRLVTGYSRHISALFVRHDLAVRLLLPELPEQLERAVYSRQPLARPRDAEHGALLAERIRLLLGRFPAVCRALDDRPWPAGWNVLDVAAGVLIPLAVLGLVLLDPVGQGPQIGVGAYAGIGVVLLAAAAVKLEFVNARGAALAGAIADAFSPVAGGKYGAEG